MGLRFRKSFKIAKGIRINIGKGGVSASLGKKGLSLNVGTRGVYSNIGIPKTGLSSRTKLLGGSGRSHSSRTKRPDQMTPEELSSFLNELNQKLRTFQFAHILTSPPTAPLEYQMLKFDKEKPIPPLRVLCGLGELSSICIWIWGFFFGLSTFFSWFAPVIFLTAIIVSLAVPETRKEYEWRLEKESFESREVRKKATFDNIIKNHPRDFVNGVLKYALEGVKCYSNLMLSCSIYQDSIFLRIDLPDYEFTPKNECMLTPSGKSITEKTLSETQRRAYYAQHIHGVAFLYVGKIFQALSFVTHVIASGYVKRANPATGVIEDVCLYSVRVPREGWEQINFSQLPQIDPIHALARFDLKRDMTKKFEFKPIAPIALPDEAKPIRFSEADVLPLDTFVSSQEAHPHPLRDIHDGEQSSSRPRSNSGGRALDLDAFLDGHH